MDVLYAKTVSCADGGAGVVGLENVFQDDGHMSGAVAEDLCHDLLLVVRYESFENVEFGVHSALSVADFFVERNPLCMLQALYCSYIYEEFP